jgi:glycosyltransferase involved in cell wall biosynthesis
MRNGDLPCLPEPQPGGRRILILDFDLYGQVGGGQSVYRRLVEHGPRDVWFYFRRHEAADAPRPAHAVGIPFIEPLVGLTRELPEHLHHWLWTWRLARNMAISVVEGLGRIDFDLVDTPDYAQHGPFIRPALAIEQCRVGAVAVSMHGTLTDAFRGGWPTGEPEGRILAELRMREHLQFGAAEVRYAISPGYAEAWRRLIDMPVNLLDPLLVTGAPAPRPASRQAGAPDLAFVGRREKWKGPDLFLDTAWCLDPASYGRLLLLGPEGANRLGMGSEGLLREAARRRRLETRLEMPGGRSREAVEQLLDGRTVLLLPSRHDTFNLTALEAICRGCPTLVSDRAGAARWLRERLPAVDWAVVGIDCSRAAAATTAAVLADYDRYRERLAAALHRAALQPDLGSLAGIYAQRAQPDVRAQETAIEIASQISIGLMDERRDLRRQAERQAARGGRAALRAARAAHRVLPVKRLAGALADRLGTIAAAGGPREMVMAAIAEGGEEIRRRGGYAPKGFGQANKLGEHGLLAAELRLLPERSAAEVETKLKRLTRAVNTLLTDRVALFREMARLERRIGTPLTAATYLLRTMRWVGGDGRGDLPFVVRTLHDHGFAREAVTAQAMFGGGADDHATCRALMQDAYRRNRDKPDLELAVLDDRRGASQPRAAVIASLYNAADKLPTLLAMLARQTLAQQGGLEVVLVDSNSPGQDRAAFAAFAAAHPGLPIVYARSAERETIQAAWNRGIKLARAPYLAFLGADEGLHPDALRILAEALDRDAGLDWAMADSIVTNVDRHGVYDSDVMPYDRSGYRQDLVYLETCYLSWVGALYRRSIHDRFGYYDESYRAAGDTEFKNRIMPHIRSAHVPLPLGIFNNYPEERTTQHPRAEIEDLRAWYLWRTPAGMDYAFAQRPVADAEALLRDCLGYRKSFCGHLSTDYDLAAALADHLLRREDRPDMAAAAWQETRRALSLIKRFEILPAEFARPGPPLARALWGLRRLSEAQGMAGRQRERLGLAELPRFEVFNDNRYEQHWWSWSAG